MYGFPKHGRLSGRDHLFIGILAGLIRRPASGIAGFGKCLLPQDRNVSPDILAFLAGSSQFQYEGKDARIGRFAPDVAIPADIGTGLPVLGSSPPIINREVLLISACGFWIAPGIIYTVAVGRNDIRQ